MSKIKTLKEKYHNIPETTFDMFVEGDPTKTKKYLQYFLEIWTNKKYNNCPNSVSALIGYIHAYDKLLPYIEVGGKDIYNSKFLDVEILEKIILEADQVKESKNFIREDHCDILIENDNYLLLRPKTFTGSLKYGANTKWCTASKTSESTFNRYYRDGLLVYLISKKKNENKNFSKVALYFDFTGSPLTGEILVWDTIDNMIDDTKMIKNGWSINDVVDIFNAFRYFSLNLKENRYSAQFITKFKQSIEKLDIDGLESHITNINKNYDITFLNELKDTINKFKNKLKTYGN